VVADELNFLVPTIVVFCKIQKNDGVRDDFIQIAAACNLLRGPLWEIDAGVR
jgi:hypothetical protein